MADKACASLHGSHLWCRPFVVRKVVIFSVVLLPLMFIGVLEGIQSSSDRNKGFVSVTAASASKFSSENWIHYLPTLVMLLLRRHIILSSSILLSYLHTARWGAAGLPPLEALRLLWSTKGLKYFGFPFMLRTRAFLSFFFFSPTVAALIGSLLMSVVSCALHRSRCPLPRVITLQQSRHLQHDLSQLRDEKWCCSY